MKINHFYTICTLLTALLTASCSDKDDGGGSSIADPEGTIMMSVRNESNGSTWVSVDGGGFNIDRSDNFYGGHDCSFVSVGPVKGLGAVTSIPKTGWSERVSVRPGYGYFAAVKFWGNNYFGFNFVRIYVEDYITSASTGGVIGAEIKYQPEYNFQAKAITLSKNTMKLTEDKSYSYSVYKAADEDRIEMNLLSCKIPTIPVNTAYGYACYVELEGNKLYLRGYYSNSPPAPPVSTTLTISSPGLPSAQITVHP